jgi:N6-L-threonylcarbamoyladenine synthase
MIVLGIETSCDETAVAIVRSDKTILAHQVFTQLQEHQAYGGVVPEIAARAHLNYLAPMVQTALSEANLTLKDLSGIAATAGPGLIGGVMVGVMMAKSLAAVHDKPFLAINHLIGHALAPRLTETLEFPYLLLLVSGGHCQLVVVRSPLDFTVLGTTQDDAVGECFDKCAKMLELPYPGGPNIEKIAKQARTLYPLPIPLKGKKSPDLACQFSFSGLKSAVRRLIETQSSLTDQFKADVAASLQQAVAETLKDRLYNALRRIQEPAEGPPLALTAVVVSGGVAANQFLRAHLSQTASTFGLPLVAPPLALCTDNGAMIAWAGIEKLRLGLSDPLSFKPRPRWPLDEGLHSLETC